MLKIFLSILVSLLLFNFVSAEITIGLDNSNSPKVFFPSATSTISGNSSFNQSLLDTLYLKLNGGNSPTNNINWNFFGIFNVGDSNFTNDVFIDNELTLGTGTSNLEIFYSLTNIFNTTGKNALFTDNLTASNLFGNNICYSNGTGCSAQAQDNTNHSFLNNTQTFSVSPLSSF